jgi:hypothetical protein
MKIGHLNLPVEKCLECDRYELEIRNLQEGLRIVKDRARAGGDKGPREQIALPREQFALMLNLAYRLDEARKRYQRHRTAHATVN